MPTPKKLVLRHKKIAIRKPVYVPKKVNMKNVATTRTRSTKA